MTLTKLTGQLVGKQILQYISGHGKSYVIATAMVDGMHTPVIGVRSASNVGEPEKPVEWYSVT